jgi:chromosomal replication initiation ATPase DnaA
MDEKCTQLWQKLSVALKPQVSADTFKRWFSAVRLIGATEDTLTFCVPNNIYQFWIESNHMAALEAAIITACGG